ncbi:helix-turn-helix domain-containing protein [Methylobacterium radiodurans]|uniref:Transcriptional regulator n=1 Tax=Methylobacterium radiodurans TaxID=2202828 RepID=A0A2U8VRU1_9HYPH|nr:helix-turn-helix transcriptional regulator [Methylobacterium radiodurans]AWN36499.1 transcriptional regulator [Methylobacterium radiodurans]
MTKSPEPRAKPKQTTEADHSVGSRVALLRSASGMSQTMLADALGISFQQVQKYEAGKNRIGAGRLRAIADRLGVPVSVFFADDPGPEARGRNELDMLQQDGALTLLQAYDAISDTAMRDEILTLVKAAARISRRAEPVEDGR